MDFDGNTKVNTYFTSGAFFGMLQRADYYAPGKVPGTDAPAQTVS